MDNYNKKINVAILGGDKRQAVIASEFLKMGHSVRYLGTEESPTVHIGAGYCTGIDKAIESADAIILPLPVTRDNIHLSAGGAKIVLSDIVKLAAKNNAVLLGGMIPPETVSQCEKLGVENYDYYKSESLQKKNALPSAEGALMIAMEHTDITVNGMKALVCGYGRIGSQLVGILDKLGADVTVGARRDETLCEISLMGYKAIRLGGYGTALSDAADNCDVIFNTVPGIIFTENVLKKVKNKPLYIEIASSPGGIDLSAARDVGIETVFAPSLPGKYAPISAGKYIYETVIDILSERRIL